MSRISEKKKSEVIKRYVDGENSDIIAKDLKISESNVLAILNRAEISIRDLVLESEKNEYPVDETFFDVIDTEEKAYFLGFLFACGINNKENGIVVLNVKKKDKEILVKLNNLIQPERPLYKQGNKIILVIKSNHICNQLDKLGLHPPIES